MTRPLALVADIGGTNARFALVPPLTQNLDRVKTLSAADYPSIDDAISAYLKWADARPGSACFAVACPARDDEIAFTNSTWRFSRAKMARHFGWSSFSTVNDFEALALGVPYARPESLQNIRPGISENKAPRAVLGPGTGFGISGLVCDQHGGWVALSGEGGHIGFAPQNEQEMELLRYLQGRFGRVSYERVLSGDGLVNIYEFLNVKAGNFAERPSPADITARGIKQSSGIAYDALKTFCAILGSVAGDLALILGSTGGVYIGGGIVLHLLPILLDSSFEERFTDKGRLSSLLAGMPIYVILDNTLALLGAAAILNRDQL